MAENSKPDLAAGRGSHGLSLQWLGDGARQVDFSSLWDSEHFDMILPPATWADVQERGADLYADYVERFEYGGDDRQPLPDEAAEEFSISDAGCEWRESFSPMMNYVWPVSLAYGHAGAEVAAMLIAHYGPAVTLLEWTEETRESLYGVDNDAPTHGLALSGGGMDLSDNLAAAYLACGCVPPWRLLVGLHNTVNAESPLLPALREAYDEAARHMIWRAGSLRGELARIADEPEPVRIENAAAGMLAALGDIQHHAEAQANDARASHRGAWHTVQRIAEKAIEVARGAAGVQP